MLLYIRRKLLKELNKSHEKFIKPNNVLNLPYEQIGTIFKNFKILFCLDVHCVNSKLYISMAYYILSAVFKPF